MIEVNPDTKMKLVEAISGVHSGNQEEAFKIVEAILKSSQIVMEEGAILGSVKKSGCQFFQGSARSVAKAIVGNKYCARLEVKDA
jgi:hypothetical protein